MEEQIYDGVSLEYLERDGFKTEQAMAIHIRELLAENAALKAAHQECRECNFRIKEKFHNMEAEIFRLKERLVEL